MVTANEENNACSTWETMARRIPIIALYQKNMTYW